MGTHPDNALTITIEILCPTFQHGIHVIIKIQELLIQVGYTMQKHLNGRAIKRGKKFLRNNIPMQYDIDLIPIYPLRHLTIPCHHQMHLTDEGHIHGYTTKQIRQCTPIAESFLQHRFIGVLLILSLPLRVEPIHICYNNIHNTTFNYDKNSARRAKTQIYL